MATKPKNNKGVVKTHLESVDGTGSFILYTDGAGRKWVEFPDVATPRFTEVIAAVRTHFPGKIPKDLELGEPEALAKYIETDYVEGLCVRFRPRSKRK